MKRFLVLLALATSAFAEKAPKLRELPAQLAASDREALASRRSALVERRDALFAKVKDHNERCTGVEEGSPRDAECRREKAELDALTSAYATDARAFNQAVTDAEVAAAVAKEQDEFEKMQAAWLVRQHEAIRQKVEAEKPQIDAVLHALRERKPAPPLTLKELLPGDVILVGPDPDSKGSKRIPKADQLLRRARQWYEGGDEEIQREELAHALTCVKSVDGRLLFLDDQYGDGKARVIEEKEFLRMYEHRDRLVARPHVPVDGAKLWTAAKDLAGTPYGVGEGKYVCSEVAGVAVGKAINRQLLRDRFGPVDLTPADFVDPEEAGSWFTLRPMQGKE